MTDPTGDALIARIKELEEALRPFAELDTHDNPVEWIDGISAYAVVTMIDIANARKALNK